MVVPARALLLIALAGASAGCKKERTPPVTTGATPVSSIPWQPHGLRPPTVRCEVETPSGWTRSASPMPDHVAELSVDGAPQKGIVMIAERVEATPEAARERVLEYWKGGPLGAEGARIAEDATFDGARAPGRVLSMRSGEPGRVESVVLLAFPGLPVVEVVARYEESDAAARDAVRALARSASCTKL